MGIVYYSINDDRHMTDKMPMVMYDNYIYGLNWHT